MTQRQLFVLSFFVFFILIFFQLVGVFKLFLTPILWAVILALVFYPLYLRVCRLLRGQRTLASLAVVLLVILLTAGPMTFFSGTLVREVLDFYQRVGGWMAEQKYLVLWNRVLNSPLRILWDKIVEKTAVLDIQIAPLVTKALQGFSHTLVGQIQQGAANFVFFILNYFVTMFIFFFLLRDGESLGKGLKNLFPMTRENKEVVFGRLSNTVSAVVRALVVTGVIQGLLAGLSFWVLQVPFPVFLSLLIAFLALVPIGGGVLVWIPAAIYLLVSVSWIKALILFLWGTVVVGTVDNIIRPWIIGEKVKIPTLFLLLSIVGGLSFYGFIGVFLGPVMLTLFFTLVEIYRKEYPDS